MSLLVPVLLMVKLFEHNNVEPIAVIVIALDNVFKYIVVISSSSNIIRSYETQLLLTAHSF